jgi:uncharacterized protein (TIGR02246 family)
MASFASQFSQNADFVNAFGLPLRGRPAIEAQHVAIHKTVFRNSQLETLDQNIRFLTPEVAAAHMMWPMTGHDTGPVQDRQLQAVRKGVLTAVLKSEGDIGRITALHNTDIVPVPGLGKWTGTLEGSREAAALAASLVIPNRLQPVRNSALVISADLPQSAARSSHVGLFASSNATFFSRRHFLICVSRAIALFTY